MRAGARGFGSMATHHVSSELTSPASCHQVLGSPSLASGALVEERARVGLRLHYRRLQGEGPDQGCSYADGK